MSAPAPGGSTRITSAPSAARVAPPKGAATKAESSTTRSPARIAASAGPGVIQGLGSLLQQARRQCLVDVFEDCGGSAPPQLLDLPPRNPGRPAKLFNSRALVRARAAALSRPASP